jgi:hypothetical protein
VNGKLNRHYARFLYRVNNFRSLFGDWFVVQDNGALLEFQKLISGKLFLNVARDRTNSAAADLQLSKGDGTERKAEADLEFKLRDSAEFAEHYGLKQGQIGRQLPVGLFSESKPTKKSAIFTGGKSAIDLIGLSGSTLWLFELKAGKNIPAGILSEMLFYAGMLRDTVRGRFRFAPDMKSGMKIQPSQFDEVNRIEAVMLGHHLPS